MRHDSTAIIGENGGTPEESQDKVTSLAQDEVVGVRWRGLRWRVLLGVLPPCPASIEELRRAAANGRRRYAVLRRRLLVDPHIMEEVQKPNHLGMDNPLSQDPESVWGRYFQNAELERTIDKDLTRLYPEHESFFQSPFCQVMLRRILLVWSLIHPHYSYRQGMHELLAPLLYVLHFDVLRFSELKRRYEDLFDDRFDDPSIQGPGVYANESTRKAAIFSTHKALLVTEGCEINDSAEWAERISPQDFTLLEPDEFGFDLRTMVLGSDIYGAEGELGGLLSGRFVEHDAYCMFDALMSGQGGAVAMAEYFMTVNGTGSVTGLSPVLDASAALYRALAAADVSLYLHLVGLGVEPQFFALRWLRVLFGREFVVDNLLLLWDAIFAAPNTTLLLKGDDNGVIGCSYSHRSAFISALAVSMLLYLRPILLSAPDATSCLQKLLNFPQTVDITSVIDNAKVLQPLAEEAVKIIPSHLVKFVRNFDQTRSGKLFSNGSASPPFRGHSTLQSQISCSPELLKYSLPVSYWEEKWKNSVLQKNVPDEVVGQQNTQASSMVRHKKSVSHDSAVLCTGSTERKEKQHLSVKETVHAVQVRFDDVNKAVRRKIFGGSAEGGKCKRSSTGRPIDIPASPQEVDSEEHDLGDAKARATNTNEHSPPLDKVSVPAGGLAPRHPGKDDTSDRQEEEVFASGCHVFYEGTSVEYDDQSSTSSVTSEDSGGNMGNSSPLQKSKIVAAGSHVGRFFWMWNFGRNGSGDNKSVQAKHRSMTSETIILANGSENSNVVRNSLADNTLKARQELNSCNEMAPNMVIPIASNAMSDIVHGLRRDDDNQAILPAAVITRGLSELIIDGSDVCLISKERSSSAVSQRDTNNGLSELLLPVSNGSQISKERGSSTVLQTLGQSMLDNIHVIISHMPLVLETALSQKMHVSNKEGLIGTTAVTKEKSEHFSKTFLSGKGQVAALTALAELRKISNILLQM